MSTKARPGRFRIATWNINSLRLRQELLGRVVGELAPDVICLQETKVPDELFPTGIGAAIGYPHVVYRGMKSYNGVAIFSRVALEPVAAPDWCAKADCRHIAVRVALPSGPVLLHDFYVPAGGDVADRAANPKFAHKLDFVAEATAHFTADPPRRTVLVGDLNIAPLENDVWSHKQLLDVVSHTPVETQGLNDWMGRGFVDAVRDFVPTDQKLYSWWSYRDRDWAASDRGRRLDHVWVSKDLVPALRGQTILRAARDWTQTSDHVPVAVDLEL